VDQKEFFREWSLLDESHKKSFPGFHIIYFSTTALEDMKRMNSPYALHKLNMENYITRYFKKYTILRLPVMVGPHMNPHTFVSKFREWIKDETRFEVQSNVVRELLDVEYLVELLTLMINEGQTGRYSIDGIPTTPCDVAILLEGIMKKPAMFSQADVTKMQVKDLLVKYHI
jgi:nucleoside-diphosphate-sugar epimerase